MKKYKNTIKTKQRQNKRRFKLNSFKQIKLLYFIDFKTKSFFLYVFLCKIFFFHNPILQQGSFLKFSLVYQKFKMVKVYYSYQFSQTVSQPVSRQCNFVILPKQKVIVAGVNQYISIIALKTGEAIKYLYQNQRNVNVRVIKATSKRIYIGYQDGRISIYQIEDWQFVCSLDLHKSTVSSIDVDENDTKMISAGLDGNIFVWDLLSEESQKIKSAHSNGITQIIYKNLIIGNKPVNVILSLGKDGFFKIWNAQSLLCMHAVSTQTTEAFSMIFQEQKNLVYIGTNRQDIPIIKINTLPNAQQSLCTIVGTIKRPNFCRCVQMTTQYNKIYLLNSQKKLEIYEFLSQQKLGKKMKRLESRRKEKEKKKNLNQDQKQQNQEVQQQQELIEHNEYELSVGFVEQKTFLTKVYNFEVVESKIYFSNGTNICCLEPYSGQENQSKLGHEITSFTPLTQQLELQFPYLVQRTNQSVVVYNSLNFNKLFKIQQKATWVSLFGGYLMLCCEEVLKVWDLAKNIQVFSVSQDWQGCWVNKTKCLLWKQNILGVYQIGYDKNKRIKLKQTTTKYLDQKITTALYTPNFEKYAVSIQNCQIHLFYADTGKQFLKLYGHKLPITSFDISSDNAVLVSSSVDKDIRFWDLDFGHCIKTVFAHEQPVTNVKFIKDTHYVVSTGKDAHIKFWDGDSHELIQDFQQSLLEVKALAVTESGDHILAGGLDGGLRIWKQTNNQTIASDQEDKKMEKVMIEEYAVHKFSANQDKTRYQDLKHGEEIIQALQQNQKPLQLLKMIKSIPTANLKASLSFLHTHHFQKLQQYLEYFIDRRYQQELCFRVLDAMERPTALGSKLRQSFAQTAQTLALNRQVFKLLSRTLKEEKKMSFF